MVGNACVFRISNGCEHTGGSGVGRAHGRLISFMNDDLFVIIDKMASVDETRLMSDEEETMNNRLVVQCTMQLRILDGGTTCT